MGKKLATLIAALVFSYAGAAAETEALHPVHTFSIVCYDSASGQFGAAVQSHWFKVADVIWAEPGVGAVATQSLTDFTYGPLGLEMMKLGRTASDALAGLLVADENREVRQVAMIDAAGNVVAHTGTKCIAEAGHHTGVNYSVQANLMEKNTVWDAMAKAFENTPGELADRMMAALEAAQAAAMIVVNGKSTGQTWKDKLVDIRVDDSPEPLPELRRLLNITRAYDQMNLGDEFIAQSKFDEASASYTKAAALSPGNLEILFWHAVTLASIGQVERSLPIFRDIFAKDDHWRTLVPRLVKAELLPDDSVMIGKILEQ
jgi:uncharacterized Ntn-hydrolase superfamily protein